MCRALVYLGEPVLLDHLLYQPDSSLVKQSYMPRMLRMLNLAGFGMMAWDRTAPQHCRYSTAI
jgi:predicted glutamine amidotransferase